MRKIEEEKYGDHVVDSTVLERQQRGRFQISLDGVSLANRGCGPASFLMAQRQFYDEHFSFFWRAATRYLSESGLLQPSAPGPVFGVHCSDAISFSFCCD